MTKNELKKIAKTAKQIISEETVTEYNGSAHQTEQEVSYDEMIAQLAHCSRWMAYQRGSTVHVSGTICRFTVHL